MAKAQIRHLFLAGPQRVKEKVFKALQRFGRFEILKPKELQVDNHPDIDIHEIEDRIKEYRQIINILGLTNKLILSGDLTPPEEKLDETIKETMQFDQQRNQLENDIHKLSQEEALCKRWEGLDLSLEDLGNYKHYRSFLGTIPSETLHKIEGITGLHYKVIADTGREARLWLICSEYEFNEVNEKLKAAAFTPIMLPAIKGSIGEHIDGVEHRLTILKRELDTITGSLKEVANDKGNDILTAHDFFFNLKGMYEGYDFLQVSDKVFFLEGWIAYEDIKDLKEALKPYEPLYMIEREPLKEENPPIVLDNIKVVEPFNYVTELFSLPNKKELDPTPFIMPFYAIFFGVCLTDAGYGITVFLAGLIFLIKYKPKGETKSLIGMLTIGGFFTIIIGLLTGGFYGINIDTPALYLAPFAGILRKLRVLNPLDQLLIFFYCTLSLGVLQIFLGRILSMIQVWRSEGAWRGIQAGLPWIMFVPGFVTFLAYYLFNIKGIPKQVISVSNYMLIAGMVLIVIFMDRGATSIVARLANGVFGLYGALSGTLSDVLSYARLLALGIATGVVAMVVNIIASTVYDVPVVGGVLAVLVFIIGHTGNILINAFGAMIHSARLQYVEFFNTFYEGGGSPLAPFKEKRVFTFKLE